MEKKDFLFISPHLDDAVFSCGAFIAKLSALGHFVTVLTLFSGSPTEKLSLLARALHMDWQLPYDAPSARRSEDLKALSIVGAKGVYADFLDCIYRWDVQSGKPRYPRLEMVLGQQSVNEPCMIDEIRDYLTSIIHNGRYDHVFAPLGIGGHVDHLITHAAVRQLENTCNTGQSHYYEDLPYAIDQQPDEPHPAGSRNYLCTFMNGEQLKHDAMAQYASQIKSPRYPDGIDIDAIINYGERICTKRSIFAERVWFLV